MLCCVNWVSWMLPMVLSGAQFKAFVEYAPSQQVPKSNIKKDGREGTFMKGLRQSLFLILCPIVPFYHITIFLNLDFVVLELLDPEYLELLELISKPTEHLPSAEIQLERKEAERAGRICHHYFLFIIVLPPFQIIRHFGFARYIAFAMHLDIHYV